MDSAGRHSREATVVWPITSGTTYTLRLGTFPGAACGAAAFSVEQLVRPPCGPYDDGSTENALGLTAGGEIGWIHVFDCGLSGQITSGSTAYGTLMLRAEGSCATAGSAGR